MAAREGEWLRTGDLGELDDAGNLYFKGRKKNVIVTAEGMNIYPEDLEAALRAQPSVRDCVVVGVERGGNAEACAVLVVEDGGESAPRAVAEANSKLGAHQQIRRWLVWPDSDFPRTSTEKPRQDVIAAYAKAQLYGAKNGNIPRSSVAAAIAGLATKSSGRQATLDGDLNLSSIDRVDLMTTLEQRYQIELDESQFAEAATVADVQRILHEASARPAESRYRYPRWAQHEFVRWIRIAIYYLLTWPATLLMAKPSVIGRERLKNVTGPLLFTSNHVTYIDPGLLMFAMPQRHRHRLAIAMQGEMLAAMQKPPKEMNVLGRALVYSGKFTKCPTARSTFTALASDFSFTIT